MWKVFIIHLPWNYWYINIIYLYIICSTSYCQIPFTFDPTPYYWYPNDQTLYVPLETTDPTPWHTVQLGPFVGTIMNHNHGPVTPHKLGHNYTQLLRPYIGVCLKMKCVSFTVYHHFLMNIATLRVSPFSDTYLSCIYIYTYCYLVLVRGTALGNARPASFTGFFDHLPIFTARKTCACTGNLL